LSVAESRSAIHCAGRCGDPPPTARPTSWGPRADRFSRRRAARTGTGVGMKFTRLRLLGFKSFVEPTDFLIEPGLTGVVGPNGREVRARDVHILFADASTGSRSPSMVHQGRIGEIIQAKPEQRRRVLEEAAGISGLHARRHEAELRLRAAEQNLARLEDVINQ